MGRIQAWRDFYEKNNMDCANCSLPCAFDCRSIFYQKQEVPTSQVPNAKDLPVGQTVYFNGPMGPFPAKVVSVDDEKCVFDMNHELAGKDLTFEIELVEVAE